MEFNELVKYALKFMDKRTTKRTRFRVYMDIDSQRITLKEFPVNSRGDFERAVVMYSFYEYKGKPCYVTTTL